MAKMSDMRLGGNGKSAGDPAINLRARTPTTASFRRLDPGKVGGASASICPLRAWASS